MSNNISEALNELNKIEEELLYEMATIVGKYIKLEDVNFSFHFSSKSEVNEQHSIRVKIAWNRERLSPKGGTLKLHGDYEYLPVKGEDIKSLAHNINEARTFFKKYKVLFAAVWEEVINADPVTDYLKGYITFSDLINEFFIEIPDKDNIQTLSELECVARENNLFNLYD